MLPIANERGNVPDMAGKRDPLDFVLWQRSLADSRGGHRRGSRSARLAHQCSAMATAYLGERFEVHGGGGDLIFPHHESELAQSEGATGRSPWVAHWAPAWRYQGEKMSKSLGNLVLVRDLLRIYPGDAIRHYLVSHHYRDEVDYTEAGWAARPRPSPGCAAPACGPRVSRPPSRHGPMRLPDPSGLGLPDGVPRRHGR